MSLSISVMDREWQSFLTKGKKQHTVEEANRSRLITELPWLVESYHARLKKWSFISCAFLFSLRESTFLNIYILVCRGSDGASTKSILFRAKQSA